MLSLSLRIFQITDAVTMGSRSEAACKVVVISARTLQRWKKTPDIGDGRHGPKKEPANKLSLEERSRVLSVVTSREFQDDSPSKIVPKLADQGIYLASESTIYRILKAHSLLAHRSNLKAQDSSQTTGV